MNPVPYYAAWRCADCNGFVRADGFVLPHVQPERGDPVAALCRDCAMRWLAALRAWDVDLKAARDARGEEAARIHMAYTQTQAEVAR